MINSISAIHRSARPPANQLQSGVEPWGLAIGIARDATLSESRHLFAAQVVTLLGTRLTRGAPGLLAYDLAGDRAAMVLGTVFPIKMVAYVWIAPIAGAFAERVNRRAFLVSPDLVRAAVALCLPFVTEIWQVYVLLFVLQTASAAFTPTFQATIPDVLPDEARSTRAVSLSRLAFDLENIVSPMRALLLTVMSYDALLFGTMVGFAGSTALVLSVLLSSPRPAAPRGIYDRKTRGIRIYLATPRLRGLHACWLVTYPQSGWLMTRFGPVVTLIVLAGLAAGAALVALRLWHVGVPEVIAHTHEHLPLDHPHLHGTRYHAHAFVVDDEHPRWASQL